MDDIVSQWYEDTKNVDEMQDWNPALKELEKSVARHFPSGADPRTALWGSVNEQVSVGMQKGP